MTEGDDPAEQLRQFAAQFVGLPCLWHTSDDRHGALLELGAKVERERPIPNDRLTPEQRQFTGTHSVFFHCRCSLDVPDELDHQAPARRSYGFLDLVVGRTVTGADVSADDLSLRMTFDGALGLVVEPGAARWYSLGALGHYAGVDGGEIKLSSVAKEIVRLRRGADGLGRSAARASSTWEKAVEPDVGAAPDSRHPRR